MLFDLMPTVWLSDSFNAWIFVVTYSWIHLKYAGVS